MVMTYNIAIIVCYFGQFPEHFPLFILSCNANPTVDFYIITDQFVKDVKNVYFITMPFLKFKENVQKCFDFEITLDKAYKICDYRPAFGVIFSDLLQRYDFWGHCDIDEIFGDIRGYIDYNILNTNDKIYQNGHLTLYRNVDRINRAYCLQGGPDYHRIFTTRVNCVFDEGEGIQKIFDANNISTYKDFHCADISRKYHQFRLCAYLPKSKDQEKFQGQIYYYENNKIYRAYAVDSHIETEEYIYIHFSGRTPRLFIDKNANIFFITNTGLYPKIAGTVTLNDMQRYNSYNFSKEMHALGLYYWKKWNRRFNKYVLHK
ncbi:DUF6625 family protein [Clostridium ljungdahlii]|uniref:Uncharacterized protein n=1 Tax=Clostridium ljungdahlii TaxID=1538 RepID=A0A168NUX7_9CLOT|nr:DUF6625 family protein [Clostridium ljungdahlii]OAA86941.1 hypothetical protein WY13_02336 [Clostridium ljungdahlii]